MKYKYDMLNEIISKYYPNLEYETASLLHEKEKTTLEENEKKELKLIIGIMDLIHKNGGKGETEKTAACKNKKCCYKPWLFEQIIPNCIDTFTQEDLSHLFKNIENLTNNPIILARVFDVLWLTKKLGENNLIAGENAIKYYKKYLTLLLEKKSYIYPFTKFFVDIIT